MTQLSYVWDGSGGSGDDGSYSATDWSNVWMAIVANGALSNAGDLNRGIIKGVLNDFEVAQQSVPDATVQVKTGAAIIQGKVARNFTASATLSPAANASGSTRYDIIVLRADYTANTVRAAIRQGTAGAGLPSLQQSAGGIWEIPLAYLQLVSGYTTITTADIFDMREIANSYEQQYAYIQNKSGAVLEAGDTVIWDSSNDQAVTTSTVVGDNIAGIVMGRIAANDFGRILTRGYGLVRVDTAIARGDRLSKSNAVQRAGLHGGIRFARALAAGSTGTRVLCYVDVQFCDGGRTKWHEGFLGIAATAPSGTVYAANNTIGDSTSGSTTASSECRSLFRQLWDNSNITYVPIFTSAGAGSTHGASADADFDAHKRLSVIDSRGRSPIALDNLGGSSANRNTDAAADNIGGGGGVETVTLDTTMIPAHTHTLQGASGSGAVANTVLQPSTATTSTATTSSTGGGLSHTNLAPYDTWGMFIKL